MSVLVGLCASAALLSVAFLALVASVAILDWRLGPDWRNRK